MDLSCCRNTEQTESRYIILWIFALVWLLVSACAGSSPSKSFDHQTCLDSIPDKVSGLTILEGPRTKSSLISDMVPAVCYSRVLVEKKKANGENNIKGDVTFEIQVEYTGEVVRVEVVETTIQSQPFVRKVADFIMDTDFVGWVQNDVDTVFIYPMSF